MEIFAIFFSKMDSLVSTTQAQLGTLVSGLLIMEVIWFAFDIFKGKIQDVNGIMWKTLAVCMTLFICANIVDISNIFLNTFLNLTSKIVNLKNVDIHNPILSGWKALLSFWDSLLKITKTLFDEVIQLPSGNVVRNPNFHTINKLYPKGEPFLMIPSLRLLVVGGIYLIVGLVLSLVLIYGYIIFYIALIEYRLILIMASIFILFTIWQPTKFLAQNVMSAIWANIIKIFTLNFIILISVSVFSNHIIKQMNGSSLIDSSGNIKAGLFIKVIMECVILGICFYMLITKAPQIANGFLSGQTSLNTLSFGKFLGTSLAVGLTGAASVKGGGKAIGNAVGSAINAFKDAKNLTGSTKKALSEALSSGGKSLGGQTLKGLKTVTNAAMTGSLGNYNREMLNSMKGGVRNSFNQGKADGSENYHKRIHDKQGALNKRGKKHLEMGLSNTMKK